MRTELVTTLKRQATELLSDIERDKEPILITQHGLPSAYLLDVETYQLMQQRMAILEGIARGEQVVAEATERMTEAPFSTRWRHRMTTATRKGRNRTMLRSGGGEDMSRDYP